MIVEQHGLVVTISSDRKTKVIDFGLLDCGPALQAGIAERFVALVRGSGTWDSLTTVSNAVSAVRAFLDQGDFGTAGHIKPLHVRTFWLGLTPSMRNAYGSPLKKVLTGLAGLPVDTAKQVGMASTNGRSKNRGERPALPDSDMETLRVVATDQIRAARDRIRAGWRVVERFQAGQIPPDHEDYEYAKVLTEIATTGDIADRFPSSSKVRRVPGSVLRRIHGSKQSLATWPLFEALFMTSDEAAAAILALAVTAGWNVEVAKTVSIETMSRVDARDGSEPVQLRVWLRKPRVGGMYDTWSETYMDTGARSKARLLLNIYECTRGARRLLAELGHDEPLLLIVLPAGLNAIRFTPTAAPLVACGAMDRRTTMKYLELWRANQGPAFAAAFPRSIRQAFVSTVHPQGHTQGTNDDYRLHNPSVRAMAKDTIEDGLLAGVSIAATILDDSAAGQEQAPRAAAAGNLERLNAGALDTVGSACQDPHQNPTTGGHCGVSLLLCLGCSNAVVLRRHLPFNWALWEQLEARRGVLGDAEWDAHWRAPHARLTQLLTPDNYFDAATIDQARASQTHEHAARAERLLNRDWDLV